MIAPVVGASLGLALLGLFGPGGPIDAPRGEPAAPLGGWTLDDEWHGTWRRILDRNGRPDPQGPLLQPAQHRQRPEYPLSLMAPGFSMLDERDFALRTRGARFWMHSDDEFSFMNRVQIKERVPMGHGDVGAFAFRFDRQDDRATRSNLLRLDFAFPDIRGSGAFVELRGYLRFEKTDLDLDVVGGWRDDRFGRVAVHVFSLDTFNNASDGLAQNRANPQAIRNVHEAPHLATALEVQTHRWRGVRGEAYLGGVFPSVTRVEYAERPDDDHHRTQSAVLGGGLVEWASEPSPRGRQLFVGVAPWAVHTRHRGERWSIPLALDQGAASTGAQADRRLYDTPETRITARVYGLARLDARLDLEVFVQREAWTLGLDGLGTLAATHDRLWLAATRTRWMPTRVFGLEASYLVLAREASGGDAIISEVLDGLDHRLVTRFLFQFGPWVWIGFGVGWDLDDPNPYDQGLMTTLVRW